MLNLFQHLFDAEHDKSRLSKITTYCNSIRKAQTETFINVSRAKRFNLLPLNPLKGTW